MTILLDTDVLIDCLRGVPAAGNWLTQSITQPFQVPGIVGMELVAGCRDKAEFQRIQQFLQSFTVVWPEPTEFTQALTPTEN